MTNLYLKTSKKKKNSRWTLTVKALVFNLKLLLLLFFVHISAHHLITHTPSPSSRCLWSTKARHVFLCRCPHPPLHVLVGRPRISDHRRSPLWSTTTHPPKSSQVPLAKFSLPPSLLLPFQIKQTLNLTGQSSNTTRHSGSHPVRYHPLVCVF